MNHSSASLSQEDLPGDFALWIFIFADMLAFGVLFVAYAFTRAPLCLAILPSLAV